MTHNFYLRFSPAYIFLNTKMLVFKVLVFLVLFTSLCKKEQSVFLMKVIGGKIIINLKELH
jgi:hypothetical protein